MRAYNYRDLLGQKYNRLTAIQYICIKKYKDGGSRAVWLWQCDCGNQLECNGTSVSRGNRKSCGCLKREKCSAQLSLKRKPNLESCKNSLYQFYRREAKRRKLEFSLDKQKFLELTTSNCHYCNQSPVSRFKVNWNTDIFSYNGLDRLHNSRGYLIDNVVPCCKTCNFAKNKMNVIEFKKWLITVYNHFIIVGRQ
jgi:hypothetical protein